MKTVIKDYHFAWKSVLLFIIVYITWLASIISYLYGDVSFFSSFVICTFCGYILFTPMHEATHGNVVGKHKKYKVIESLIGNLSAMSMFIPYNIFKHLHLQHHSFTNNKNLDPDYWVASRNPLLLLIKIFTIKPHYYYHVVFKPKSVVKRERLSALSSLAIYGVLIILGQIYFSSGLVLFLLWFGSSLFSLAILAFAFDWLPHTPHDKSGRYLDTKIIDKSFLTYPMLYQNYHLSHHLYPRVPFYNYKKVFQELEGEIELKGGLIIR